MGKRLYSTLYERLVANTELEHEDNPCSCWLWKGSTAGDSDYPRVPVRVPGKKYPINRAAHRAMIEEVHDCEFPEDEGGHLCYNPRCISPLHVEAEAPALNFLERRGCAITESMLERRMIPILFPRDTHPDNDPCIDAGTPHPAGEPCPF